MYWAYLGPLPAPVIPHFDLWVRKDGRRRLLQQPRLDCNWLQAMENSVDPAHLQILHQALIANGKTITSTTRGLTDDVAAFEFYETSYGIIKKRTYTDGLVDEHPLIFPNILRQGNATQIRVPIDDEHTRIFFVRFEPSGDGDGVAEDESYPVEYVRSYKEPQQALHPFARFRMDEVQAQDHMAWETQGPIADRTTERLSSTDRGVVMLRRMVSREIDRVAEGHDPLGVVRDPNHVMIDTKLSETLDEMRVRRSARLGAAARS
jgi:5,5'-dehydrodivanillate O-demethylase